MATDHETDMLEVLLGGLAGGLAGAEATLARQQTRAQAACGAAAEVRLPAKCDAESRRALAAAGVAFGAPVAGDPLFVAATLPAGWALRPAPRDPYYSHLLDARGSARASMFYKAAFYDRDAFMSALGRYTCGLDFGGAEWAAGQRSAVVRDRGAGDAVVFRTASWTDPPRLARADYERRNAAEREAAAWLDANRPAWRDAAAYWDDAEPGAEAPR